WLLDSTIQRTNGTSGWQRANPSPYTAIYRRGTKLSAVVGVTDTTISVTQSLGFDASGAAYPVTIDTEQMLVTGGQGTNTGTVQRAQGGTKAATHPSGRGVYGPATASWAEMMALNLIIQPEKLLKMPDDPTGMNRLYTATGASVTYASYARGALAIAA